MADSQKRADRNSRNRNYRRRVPQGQKPGKDDNQWRKASRTFFFWIMLILFTVLAIQLYRQGKKDFTEISYSEFMKQLENGNVKNVLLVKKELSGEFNEPVTKQIGKRELKYSRFKAVLPFDEPELLAKMREKNVEIRAEQESFNWSNLFLSLLPFLLLGLLWVFLLRQMQGGTKGIFSFGKSKAHLWTQDRPKITFEDVAGADEAKQELYEIIEFLKDPGKFQKLGGKIPKGALLLGPPGTGKTLLAKAVAGEAGVPFLSMSGSDFVEMFVGVGASRVRDLFEQGKKLAPCIIFIDEIDAVGRHRGAGLGGGHDEREQTLNQLLVEMDGFEGSEGVIVIAATNRPDVLDPALLRPGRFDRQVVVPLPDVRGRAQILKVHMRKVPIADNVEPSIIAIGTPGFSGADLANLINEAALFAARANKRVVDMEDFEKAKDKIMMGAERRSMVMSDEEKKLTAYHESGHAIVGRMVPSHDPIHKVSIIPRGRALGVTMFLPEEDRHSYSKQRLESQLSSMFGGRVAEELIFGKDMVTTGASNDIQRSTEIARNMVTKWGLSDKLGPLTYSEDEGEVFLGHSVTQRKGVSDETNHTIDQEVRTIVDRNYARAEKILRENVDKLHSMAKALIKYETIDSKMIDDIMAGKEPRPPQGWGEDTGSKPDSGLGAEADASGQDKKAGPKIGGPVGEH